MGSRPFLFTATARRGTSKPELPGSRVARQWNTRSGRAVERCAACVQAAETIGCASAAGLRRAAVADTAVAVVAESAPVSADSQLRGRPSKASGDQRAVDSIGRRTRTILRRTKTYKRRVRHLRTPACTANGSALVSRATALRQPGVKLSRRRTSATNCGHVATATPSGTGEPARRVFLLAAGPVPGCRTRTTRMDRVRCGG